MNRVNQQFRKCTILIGNKNLHIHIYSTFSNMIEANIFSILTEHKFLFTFTKREKIYK